jgi:hypothetical protein
MSNTVQAFDTFVAPVEWATALIYGDESSFDFSGAESLELYQDWCQMHADQLSVVSYDPDSVRPGKWEWDKSFHTLATYTYRVQK